MLECFKVIPSVALRIPTAHDFRVIIVHTLTRTRTKRKISLKLSSVAKEMIFLS